VYVWRNAGQTVEQAIAAEFPDDVTTGVDVTMINWQETECPAIVLV
jgi:hypothetical protein